MMLRASNAAACHVEPTLKVMLISGSIVMEIPRSFVPSVMDMKRQLGRELRWPHFKLKLMLGEEELNEEMMRRLSGTLDVTAVFLEFPGLVHDWDAAFLAAVASQDLRVAEDLLGKAQDPNCFFSQFSDSDFSGFTALTAASFLGNRQLVELLCQAKAALDALDMRGFSALQIAIRRDHADLVQLLLQSRANANLNGTRGTALLEAASHGRLTAAQLLLEAGAEKDLGDSEGRSPLLEAASSGHGEVVKLLLQARANVDEGQLEVVRLLLHAEADVNASRSCDRIPLVSAAARGFPEVARLLLEAAADLGRTARNGQTALQAGSSLPGSILLFFIRIFLLPYILA
eukprot:s3292_g5.t2